MVKGKMTSFLKLFSSQRKVDESPLYMNESFSQCGEDRIIDYVFRLRGITSPSYIDIGANHPFYLNNTAIFYQRGCRGINIEANPNLIDKFNFERPNDINLNIGIGSNENTLDFYIISDSTLSTFSKSEALSITSSGKYSIESVQKVNLTTVEKVLDQYWDGEFPDFMTLDVEGLDFDILKSINFDRHFPKVICVEAAEYSPIGAGARRNEIIEYVVKKGYYEYANTNLNAIFVKNEFWFI